MTLEMTGWILLMLGTVLLLVTLIRYGFAEAFEREDEPALVDLNFMCVHGPCVSVRMCFDHGRCIQGDDR